MNSHELLGKLHDLECQIALAESKRAEILRNYAEDNCPIQAHSIIEVRGHRAVVGGVRVSLERDNPYFILDVTWLRKDGRIAIGRGGQPRTGEVNYIPSASPDRQQVHLIESAQTRGWQK